MPLYAEAGRTPVYALLVGPAKIALGKTEVIQGVEQVGFAGPVVAANADDPFPEPERGLGIILELYDGYVLYAEQRYLN
jgi:hypothetical protein